MSASPVAKFAKKIAPIDTDPSRRDPWLMAPTSGDKADAKGKSPKEQGAKRSEKRDAAGVKQETTPGPSASKSRDKAKAKQKGPSRSRLRMFNAPKKSRFAEMFVELLGMEWSECLFWLVGLLAAVISGFACIYWTLRDGFEFESADPASQAHIQFTDAFLYSISLTSTLGQANIHPVSSVALLAANAHAMAVQLVLVFVTGVFFARLEGHEFNISCADKMILSHFNRRNVLKTRLLFNSLADSIVDARFCIEYRRRVKLPEGGSFFKIDSLSLIKSHMMTCRVGMTVMHRIDESSPLYGKTRQDIVDERAEFQLSIIGFEPNTMQRTLFTKDFVGTDVVSGVDFKDNVIVTSTGPVIEHSNLNKVKPDKPFVPGSLEAGDEKDPLVEKSGSRQRRFSMVRLKSFHDGQEDNKDPDSCAVNAKQDG